MNKKKIIIIIISVVVLFLLVFFILGLLRKGPMPPANGQMPQQGQPQPTPPYSQNQ